MVTNWWSTYHELSGEHGGGPKRHESAKDSRDVAMWMWVSFNRPRTYDLNITNSQEKAGEGRKGLSLRRIRAIWPCWRMPCLCSVTPSDYAGWLGIVCRSLVVLLILLFWYSSVSFRIYVSLFSNVSHRYLVYIFSRTQISLSRYRLIFCRSFLLSTSLFWQTFHAHIGGLRLVGSLKLYVSFAKQPYKRDDILQKRPII